MRQGRTGKKVKIGSHLEGPRASQCKLCDRGQHRRCIDLKPCSARKRGPPGSNKPPEESGRKLAEGWETRRRPAPRARDAAVSIAVALVAGPVLELRGPPRDHLRTFLEI